jgi:Flp pilus assembly protein TadG
MMRRLKLFRTAAEERGAVLVITAAVMFSLLLVAAYAIDTALWFVHRAHLQTQADAAALAASQSFEFPCTSAVNTAITSTVHQYDGSGQATPIAPSPYTQAVNTQVYDTPTPTTDQTATGHNLYSLVNSPTFAKQSIPPDSDPFTGQATWSAPCSDATVDVKMTETNLPSVLNILSPAFIDAQAQVGIFVQTTAVNPSAFIEPLGNPDTVSAQIVNEDSSGAAVASAPLTQNPNNPNEYIGTATLPSTVPTALLGTEVTLTGNNQSVTYDSATPPPYGLAYAHVWSARPAVRPILRRSATCG